MRRKRWCLGIMALVLILSLGAVSCDGERAARRREAVDTLTRRQKDSLLSTMPVPGARGVGKALEAADSLTARAERHDTMR